jgi:hypothetical protein
MALKQGSLEKSKKMVLEALYVKFGKVPTEIAKTVNGLDNEDKLDLLHRQAIQCVSLDEFVKQLNDN